jgi:hypothetical protein
MIANNDLMARNITVFESVTACAERTQMEIVEQVDCTLSSLCNDFTAESAKNSTKNPPACQQVSVWVAVLLQVEG